MAITLLRHASVAKEYQKRYLGHSDVDIDESLFDYKKVEAVVSKKFDLVYASTLKRTGQTLKKLGKNFLVDARLNEVKFNDEIELKNFDEVEQLDSYNVKYLDSYESWSQYVCCEPLSEFRARVQSFMDELPKDKEILICTHGGVLKMLFDKNFEYLDFHVIS
ncbi:histidine phosphatase family protein [Sulfurospirillum arcachonense]|uniref:histidine phosphatase family protein n=1 Tax=Sulfurospirillum arcachonense TaxID=57666 RepID=UPI00046A83C7|nr:histidine phosphatase family protein [Sulfurospirillum arcachonense]